MSAGADADADAGGDAHADDAANADADAEADADDAASADADATADAGDAADADAAADAADSDDVADAPALPDSTPGLCDPIGSHAKWALCDSGPGMCAGTFDDSAGCLAFCAAVGLACTEVWENIDGVCAADTDRPALSCSPESGHQSDWCLCGAKPACIPDCSGKTCGDDGCGGSCGGCAGQGQCLAGQCVACAPQTCASSLLECGSGHADGCGGTFSCAGACPPGLACDGGFCGTAPKPCTATACDAFPGAEGEGRFAKGGRGGDVCHVTSLSDAGAGTLRECATTQTGPRTVVFDVAGLITLGSPLTFSRNGLTLAGQTAPGDGIQIRGYQVMIKANDVIIQHLRFRAGDTKKKSCPSGSGGFTEDSLTVQGSRIIVDHVSASWGIDESLSGGSEFTDVTVQFSIIAEGLRQTGLFHGDCVSSYNPGGSDGHSMGSLFKPSVGDGTLSMHHNLFAHNNNRNPALGTYKTDQTMRADLRNNVIYNCPSMGYVSGASKEVKVNYIGNYAIFGPSSGSTAMFKGNGDSNVQLYTADNRIDTDRDGVFDGKAATSANFTDSYKTASSPFAFEAVTTHSATAALPLVLAWAGACPWSRDAPDVRVVNDVKQGKGSLINSPSSVGGWGALAAGTAAKDSDKDGMPDAWEALYGSDPALADNNGDLDGDGYTNLEAYLHWASRPTQ